MSQPQLTSFFSHAKRGTRATNKSTKLLDTGPVEELAPPKRSTRGSGRTVEVSKTSSSPPRKTSKPEENSNKDVQPSESGFVSIKNVKEIIESEPLSDKSNEKELIKEPVINSVKKSTRGRRKVVKSDVEEVENDENENHKKGSDDGSCPSPAKRSRSSRSDSSKVLEKAVEQAKSLQGQNMTPTQVKEKLSGLKGRNKLKELQDKLKTIEKEKQTVEQAKAKAKKIKQQKEEVEAKKNATEALNKTPAHQAFHNLAQKGEAGILPLPYSYKFLGEVFRCTDTIAAMLHNRKEIVTVEKLKKGVQQMLRKNFTFEYLKQIKTVFPAAYKYAWEHVIGRYGKKLAEYELQISVNLNYKNDTIVELGGIGHKEEIVGNLSDKLGPSAMVERRTLFTNSLQKIVKDHHHEFCKNLEEPVELNEEKLVRYHKEFNVDAVPEVPLGELPVKPDVEVCVTAAEVLTKARTLFEVNPKLSEALEKVVIDKTNTEKENEKAQSQETDKSQDIAKTDDSKVKEAVKIETPKLSTPVRKELAGLPAGLLEKIRAKEAAKAAKEMFGDKEKDDRVKQLKRLPCIARTLRNIMISERKAALPHPLVLKKGVASYPGFISNETLTNDLKKLVELTKPWATLHMVQGVQYVKVNQSTDINSVVSNLEKNLADEIKK